MANTLKFGNGEWYGKKDTILAYNDENNNYKPLPFSFDRASSATVVNKAGLIETVGSGEPRIDYKDDANGALKLEPQRTNVVPYSENLNGTGWNVYGSTGGTCARTLNYGISPSGKQDSTRVVFSEALVALYMSTNITGDASATMYVKGVSGEVIGFGYGASVSSGSEFTFNGEWQRLEYNGTSANSILSINTWSTTRTARDFEIYGVQMEEGSYASSLINTQGSTVTRLADVCNNGGNEQVINSTEGVLYAEIAGFSNDTVRYSISDGSNSNNIYIELSSSAVSAVGRLSAVNQFSIFSLQTITNYNKIAIKYKQNDFALWINGVEVGTDTSGNTYPTNTLDSLQFNRGDGGVVFYGNTKDLRVYNTALTDSELQKLTTI